MSTDSTEATDGDSSDNPARAEIIALIQAKYPSLSERQIVDAFHRVADEPEDEMTRLTRLSRMRF